jgi:electron transfer flavoprotein alpha subunit
MNQDIYVVIEHLRGQVAEISYVMLTAAHELALFTGGKVVALLLGHNANTLANDLAADEVLYADDSALVEFTSQAYQIVLTHVIKNNNPRAVLFGHTSIGTDVANCLSARLDIPLVTSVRKFTSEGNFISQICGGKLMAEGDLPEPIAIITIVPGEYKPDAGKSSQPALIIAIETPVLENLQVSLKDYIEPETGDVDISKEPILISIGRGIQNQDNIVLADELAQALGGVVCASRPVVDQGWLPTSRLVGKSGKAVKPKIYLAIGISGAPEHVEAITGSDVIIAINTDPVAPIFNLAKYGTTADLFDLVPLLTEKVNQVKGS